MRRVGLVLLACGLLGSPLESGEPLAPPESFRYGAAGTVTIYRPSRAPEGVALFVSGDGGWNEGVVGMAERLRELGGVVVGIDIRRLLEGLVTEGGACAYPAGDLEELSRAVQLHLKLPEYRPPVLVGYSSGATLVYAVLASAPPSSFAGVISLGFCPDLEIARPLCQERELTARARAKGGYDVAPAPRLETPWFVLQGEIDQVCDAAATRAFASEVPGARLRTLPRVGHGFSVARNWDPAFVEAWRELASRRSEAPRPSLPALEDLPLVEVEGPPGRDDRLAVLLSGDGGWAELDQQLAAALAARGIPVVGWSSLRYFWTPRTPEAAARDLERVLRRYLSAWGRERALLVGYSFGADALPFLASRLPVDLRQRLAGVALVGLSAEAAFEFHVASWVGGGGEARYPTVPEVERLSGVPVACLKGAEEKDSACDALRAVAGVRVVTLPGGHHFGGDARPLADALLGDGGR